MYCAGQENEANKKRTQCLYTHTLGLNYTVGP